MVDIGCRVMQTVTSTLCEQFGPAIREPLASLANSHYHMGTQMVGGTVHWQAAGNGGPLTVTFVPASATPIAPQPAGLPMPPSLPPIEDGPVVTSLSPPPSSGTTKPKPLAHIQRSIAPHWRSPGDPSWGLGASGPVLVLRRPGCDLWLGII